MQSDDWKTRLIIGSVVAGGVIWIVRRRKNRTKAVTSPTMKHPVTINSFVKNNITTTVQNRLIGDFRALRRPTPWAILKMAWYIITKIERHQVDMHDGRKFQEESGLSPAEFFEKYSFVLLKAPTAMKEKDWEQEDRVGEIYGPEVKKLVTDTLKIPGAQPDTTYARALLRGPGKQPYGSGVHQDFGYTPDEMKGSINAFSEERGTVWRNAWEKDTNIAYNVINFWRPVEPMKGPVKANPLGVIDPHTVKLQDTVRTGFHGFSPTNKPTVQLGLKYSNAHKWYYYPEMTTEEVLVFRQAEMIKGKPFDDPTRAVFHSAFEDPVNAPPGTEKRTSAEYRVPVWFRKAQD
eukprot:TRINITY_DN67842_c4_g1_i1.p1 TRINITY_DN67842_c4_g1~~TRINITY_DN67842_c4_g1_i1.p1  ORF type:complete len:348 (+),score=32.84 TRINITY_DN67842_c4_g1_i1:76-1119(+)